MTRLTETVYALPPEEPAWSVPGYLERIEKALIDILSDQEPVDQTITLWCGLDGLRLDEYGELKWISRKNPEPVNQTVFYQPCQSLALMSRNVQMQMTNLSAQMQACCVQPYYGRGW